VPIVRFVYTIYDGDGDTSPLMFRANIDGATTVAELETLYAIPFWDVVVNFIQGGLSDVNVSVSFDPSGWEHIRDSSSVTADVEEKAIFKFRTPIGTVVEMSIPTFFEGYFTGAGAGKKVDITDADVLAFLALMTEDIGSGGVDAVDSHGTDISVFVDAFQWFGRR